MLEAAIEHAKSRSSINLAGAFETRTRTSGGLDNGIWQKEHDRAVVTEFRPEH